MRFGLHERSRDPLDVVSEETRPAVIPMEEGDYMISGTVLIDYHGEKFAVAVGVLLSELRKEGLPHV